MKDNVILRLMFVIWVAGAVVYYFDDAPSKTDVFEENMLKAYEDEDPDWNRVWDDQ